MLFRSDGDYQYNDQWGVTGGLRYSRDEKDFSWDIRERSFGASLPSLT